MVNGPKWKPILKVDQCGSVKETLCLKKHYLFIYFQHEKQFIQFYSRML